VFCGTSSGRSVDKVKNSGLTMVKGQSKETLIIEECKLFYECHILEKNAIDPNTLDAGVIKSYYPNRDFHTVYYGEIKHSHIRE